MLVFKEKYLSVEMLLPLTRAISKVSFFWKQKLPNFCFYMVSPFFIAWLLFTAMRNSASTFLITSSTWAEIYNKKSIQYFWNLERSFLSCWTFYSSNKLNILKGCAPCHYWAKNFVNLKIPIIPCLSIFLVSVYFECRIQSPPLKSPSKKIFMRINKTPMNVNYTRIWSHKITFA